MQQLGFEFAIGADKPTPRLTDLGPLRQLALKAEMLGENDPPERLRELCLEEGLKEKRGTGRIKRS
jgi:hypothetical protein